MRTAVQRMSLADHAPRQFAAMFRFQQSIRLERGLGDLISLRASQVNDCAFCVDMHSQDMRAAGESDERIHGVALWRESPLFNERERAALELCEAVTLVAETHVPDAVWERALASFDEDELAQLVFAIAAINAWNRLNVATRREPGD